MSVEIHQAIWQGSLETAKSLLESGVDRDLPDRHGWSPLSRAIELRHSEIAQLLLEWGADVHAQDRRGRQPLLWAAQYGPDSIVEDLLKRGADPMVADANGKKPLVQAVRHQRTAIVKMLLQAGQWTRWGKQGYWNEGMLCAIQVGRLEIINAFLDHGENDDLLSYRWAKRSSYDITFLMKAVVAGNMPVVELMLQRGANVWAQYGRHSALTEVLRLDGEQGAITQRLLACGPSIGLEEAVVAGRSDLAERFLVEGAPAEMPDENEQTLLVWAAAHGRAEMVRLLARFGADPCSQDKYGFHALMGAASWGDIALSEFLIERGIDPNVPTNEWQEPPLARAAGAGHLEATRWFLERFGPGPDRGAFALDVASARNHPEIVRLLLDAGVDVNTGIDYHHGRTPLMWAALNGSVPLASLLLERGADVRAGGGEGYGALSFAAGAGSTGVVRLLLTPELSAGHKNAVLLSALSTAHKETAEVLLEAGADPNATGYYGRTPLMWAARMRQPTCVESLLRRGAQWGARDDQGKTARMWAEEAGRTATAALLTQYEQGSIDGKGISTDP
ncbi:MAG: Ankyrin [Chthonomonadales bacterium]|nr:Ankyrin [Chthonomonadales bacterium]